MSKHWRPTYSSRKRRRPARGRSAHARLILLAVTFAFAAHQGWPGSQSAQAGTSREHVDLSSDVEVIDGDTFDYEGERIRIADIDTPEVRARCDEEAELAARATDRLEELLSEGPFELESLSSRDEDRYGRKLRVVTRDGRSIGDRLVAEGLARTWSGRREPWCDPAGGLAA